MTFIKPNILSKSDLKISVKVARSRKRWQVLFLVHYLLSVFKKTKKSQMRQKTKTIFQFCKKIWKIYAFVFVPLLFSSKCQEKLNFVCKLLKQKRRKKKAKKKPWTVYKCCFVVSSLVFNQFLLFFSALLFLHISSNFFLVIFINFIFLLFSLFLAVA